MVLFLLFILFVIFYGSVYFTRNQSEQILILATLGLVEILETECVLLHSYQQGVERELHVPAPCQIDVVHQQQAGVQLHEDGQQLQNTGGNTKCPKSDVNTNHVNIDDVEIDHVNTNHVEIDHVNTDHADTDHVSDNFSETKSPSYFVPLCFPAAESNKCSVSQHRPETFK